MSAKRQVTIGRSGGASSRRRSGASSAHRSQPQIVGSAPSLGSGELLAATSDRIVAIVREQYGLGPMRAKAYALDDVIVVVMRQWVHRPGADDHG